MLTRAELKQRAKDSMSAASTHPVLVALVFLLITMVVSGISSFILTLVSSIFGFGAAITGSSTLAAGSVLATFPLSVLIWLIIFSMNAILSVGFSSFTLMTIRHQEAGIDNLFQYFKYFLKVFCLYFMIQLFTFLWSLLFLIPGIIAAMSYQQAIYIFIDDPSKGILQCISESKVMMAGHKWEFFVLMLSFLLWSFLTGITCGIAAIYVFPYIQLTNAVYYDNLKYISTPPQYQQAAQPQTNL